MESTKSELRSYLLAEPGSAGHEEIETWLGEVDDPTFDGLLDEVEDEIIDDFVWDELSDDEIGGFESNFLRDEGRRRKLAFALSFARALQRRAGDQSAPALETQEKSRARILSFRPRLPAFAAQPAWGMAIAATLAVVTIGGVWSFVEGQRLRRELARTAVERVTPAVASIWLSPGRVRGGGEMDRVILPAEDGLVELLLDLGVDDYESYRATLHDAEGDELWSQSQLAARSIGERVALTLLLPTSVLPRGDYSVRLSGATAGGDLELAGRYYLRVVRNP